MLLPTVNKLLDIDTGLVNSDYSIHSSFSHLENNTQKLDLAEVMTEQNES
jgi:hypothetical protein